jgi:hypothetical protein
MAHRGQRRQVGAGFQDVVKANDRHVVGDAPPYLAQDFHGAQGRQVVAGQHGAEWRAGGEDLPHGGAPILAPMFAKGEQAAILLEAGATQRLAEGGQAFRRVAAAP